MILLRKIGIIDEIPFGTYAYFQQNQVVRLHFVTMKICKQFLNLVPKSRVKNFKSQLEKVLLNINSLWTSIVRKNAMSIKMSIKLFIIRHYLLKFFASDYIGKTNYSPPVIGKLPAVCLKGHISEGTTCENKHFLFRVGMKAARNLVS